MNRTFYKIICALNRDAYLSGRLPYTFGFHKVDKIGAKSLQVVAWEGPTRARGEPVVSMQMNQLSLRNNRLKLETSGELPVMLEEYLEEYTSKE